MNCNKIGIVVADTDEYKALRERVEQGDFERLEILNREAHKYLVSTENGSMEVISILCGIGKVNAAAATVCLISMGCDIILNYGLSGGVSGIGRGEITLPDRFLEHDFDLQVLGYKPCEKPAQASYIYNADKSLMNLGLGIIPNAKLGTAVTGDRFICDDVVRVSLAESFNAMSCDMETAAIAYVCEYSSTPFLAVRRVSDDAGNDAKDAYRIMNNSDETLLYDYVETIIKALI
ncbi:MAG: 5'-methylthioadenosine/S-adenosylhomocysteine nucleosidase [Ruminococcaceae bacterium]|nr:5'-methylthioadenosine/S-adenosylhomocysteine nucleosidase [Oscillospiraceae bacterium]